MGPAPLYRYAAAGVAALAFVADPLEDHSVLLSFAWLSVAAVVIEVTYIAVQAGRQRRSHVDKEMRIEAAIDEMPGIGALLLLSPAVVVGIAAARSPPAAWPPAVRIAAAAALWTWRTLALFLRTLADRSLPNDFAKVAA